MNKYIPNSIIRQIGYIALFLIVGGVIIYNLAAFIPGFLGAICMYILLQDILRWLHIKKKWNVALATLFLMLTMAVIIIVPMYFLVDLITQKVSGIITDKTQVEHNINLFVNKIHSSFGINIFDEKYISKAMQFGAQMLQAILNTTLNSVMQLGIAFFLLYFMLTNYKKLDRWLLHNIPIKNENLSVINKELRALVISNAVGVPLVSFLQAVVALIGFWIFGLNDAFSWFILMIFAGMIPIVGTALVYIPAFIIMIANGQTPEAYFLLAFCILVVGSVDNIFRFLLQKKMADVHPLVTVFGVIVGVNLFGFIGIIFGPILFSVLFWMYRLYNLEFSKETIHD